MRFVNDNIKLKNGGRNAIKISKDELRAIMRKVALKNNEYLQEELGDVQEWDTSDCKYQVVMDLMSDHLDKDNKFNVDMENCLVEHEDEYEPDDNEMGIPLMGFQTLDNGLTFFGFIAGGDWECSVFMIIYWDGKKLRSYTPTYGNTVNAWLKCAFGSEGYSDIELSKRYEELVEIVQDADEYEEWEVDDDNVLTTAYLHRYDLRMETMGFNWDAIKEDIMARIVVNN